MVTRTFLSKCTTIFEGSKDNFGLNPIGMLNYGGLVSRCMLYFDIDKIKKSFEEDGFSSDSTKHIMHLKNCGSIDEKTFGEMINNKGLKERASSFDIIAFRIPEFWDGGRGFDNSTDYWFLGKNAPSQHGANWFYAYDGKPWGTTITESGEIEIAEGIYNRDFLADEYKKFSKGEESVIICRQHFDKGNEDFKLDITSYVNEILSGDCENFGIGMAFTPTLEEMNTDYTQYVGFFTNNTNTFFQPYVESRSNEAINDGRYSFHLGSTNKLYFYARFGGVLEDLDTLPVCTINGVEYAVKRQKKGVYFAEVKLGRNEAMSNQILYDEWSNLIYKGENFDDVEMEFVVLPREDFFQIGEAKIADQKIEPSLSGINDSEKIYQGDERTVKVIFKIPYTSTYELVNESYYRIYVKDGKREIDVIDWDDINIMGMYNFFQIKTDELLPGEYFVDIKARIGNDIRIFKNKLCFTIVDNITSITK